MSVNEQETVACAVCGKRMRTINNKHLAQHGLTADDYRSRYPGHALLSEAAQQKLSDRSSRANAARKGKPRSDADIAAIRRGIEERGPHPSKGRKRGQLSDEHRQNISVALRRSFESGRVHPMQGKQHTDETRAKIAARLIGQSPAPETIKKAIATKRERGYDMAFFRGHTHTEETKRKIAEKTSARYLSTRAETRAPMLERIAEANLTLANQIDDPIFHLICNDCGHVFTRMPQMFQPSKWKPEICDQCFPVSPTSLMENGVAVLLKDLSPSERVIRSDLERIRPLELDILLPDRNLAVEFCGLYWHSELAGKTRFYHRYKLEACEKQKLRLITIFEDEWTDRQPIVEGMLRNLLGLNETRIDARACTVERLDSDAANAFLNANHIQGRGRSNARYGLSYQGELVAVMSFHDSEVSRRMSGWEINRFCCKLGVTVRGAASRLFAHFLRDHDPSKVVSYADLRWGTGDVYRHLGFTLEGRTVPNYWYFKPGEQKRFHRYGLRKQPTEPKDRTEWELRQEQGWNRIWDCGHAKWVWCKP